MERLEGAYHPPPLSKLLCICSEDRQSQFEDFYSKIGELWEIHDSDAGVQS